MHFGFCGPSSEPRMVPTFGLKLRRGRAREPGAPSAPRPAAQGPAAKPGRPGARRVSRSPPRRTHPTARASPGGVDGCQAHLRARGTRWRTGQGAGGAARAHPGADIRHPSPSRGRCSVVSDPSAGSPTETLLRLLLPLSGTVRTPSQGQARIGKGFPPLPRPAPVQRPH
jgi:hypothetical protein